MASVLSCNASAIDPICVTLLQDRSLGVAVPIRSINDLQKRMGTYDRFAIFPGPDDVWIDINPDHTHATLRIADLRYEGDIYPILGRVRENQNRITPGIYLKINGLPPENLERLKTRMKGLSKSQLLSVSCYHGICQHLDASGIHIPGQKRVLKWPSEIFRKLVTKGLVTETGVPLRMEIYRTRAAPLVSIEDKLRARQELEESGFEKDPPMGKSERVALAVFAIYVGGSAIWAIVEKNKREIESASATDATSPADSLGTDDALGY